MALIEPVKQELSDTLQKKKYSSGLRLWHWLSAIVISGSLLTVLANSTITNGHTNAGVIQKSLAEKNLSVSQDQARSAAHEIGDRVWELHTYFGYTLIALFIFRLILELSHRADQKLIRKLKFAYAQLKREHTGQARHDVVVKSLYITFYVLLGIMGITGLCMAFEDDVPALKIHALREIHSVGMYFVLAFIIVHLAGVFLAERKDNKGIVSDMINGGSAGE
ncbi:MAG: cytochrome b/b6 domain-containing protein [Bacteroidetes bacterium]|jgi:Ni,Fe-hydrogenase I cytochrome b subunit|nr:cytochrome b/b6 domain-containing protein [Bacteroidota bacterium]